MNKNNKQQNGSAAEDAAKTPLRRSVWMKRQPLIEAILNLQLTAHFAEVQARQIASALMGAGRLAQLDFYHQQKTRAALKEIYRDLAIKMVLVTDRFDNERRKSGEAEAAKKAAALWEAPISYKKRRGTRPHPLPQLTWEKSVSTALISALEHELGRPLGFSWSERKGIHGPDLEVLRLAFELCLGDAIHPVRLHRGKSVRKPGSLDWFGHLIRDRRKSVVSPAFEKD
jgi:hypothetical protein